MGPVASAKREEPRFRWVHPERTGRVERLAAVLLAAVMAQRGQPCLLLVPPCFHRDWRRGHRPEHLAPFNREHVTYTDDFEEYVVRMLIGSNEEDVAWRLDFGKFWTTYDNWKKDIPNDFDGRYTSAAVEGINNKGRGITKRCHGVKSAGTFFKRIVLDVNRASEAVGRGIAEMREIIAA